MTTATAEDTARFQLAHGAAEAALAVLPTSEPLEIGQPTTGPLDAVPPGQAVTARFTGTATGEIVIVVGQDLAAIWIYIVGPVLGAIIGWSAWRILDGGDVITAPAQQPSGEEEIASV